MKQGQSCHPCNKCAVSYKKSRSVFNIYYDHLSKDVKTDSHHCSSDTLRELNMLYSKQAQLAAVSHQLLYILPVRVVRSLHIHCIKEDMKRMRYEDDEQKDNNSLKADGVRAVSQPSITIASGVASHIASSHPGIKENLWGFGKKCFKIKTTETKLPTLIFS